VSHHFTSNTESVTAWCNACNRFTDHTVSHGRQGRCLQHTATAQSKRQILNHQRLERERQNPTLFNVTPLAKKGD
jgi:ribosomal protein L44E